MRYLIFFIIAIIFCACLNNSEDCVRNYIFEIPISVSPQVNVLNVGDTLTVSMVNDNTILYDRNDNRVVNFPNFDPNAWFLMPLLDSFPIKDGFLENEILISESYETNHIEVSTLSSGIFFLGIDTTDLESRFDFQVVLKTPGTYALYSISEIHRNEYDLCFPNKCNGCGYASGGINGEFKYTSNTNQEILLQNHLEVEDKYWIDRARQRRESSPYYFSVVE